MTRDTTAQMHIETAMKAVTRLTRRFVPGFVALAAAMSVTSAAQAAPPVIRTSMFVVEQDGKVIPAVNGIVALRRAPFTLTVQMGKGMDAQVLVSTEPSAYDVARTDAPLAPVFPFGHGMAERDFNPSHDLMLTAPNDIAFHQWQVDSQFGPHRFNAVDSRGDSWSGHRIVERVMTRSRQVYSLAELPEDTLYLVGRLMKGVEFGRSAIRLRFTPLPQHIDAASASAAPTSPVPGVESVDTRPLLAIGSHTVSRGDFERVYRRSRHYAVLVSRRDGSPMPSRYDTAMAIIGDEVALEDGRRLGLALSTADAEAEFHRRIAIDRKRPVTAAEARSAIEQMFAPATYDEAIEVARRLLTTQRVTAHVLRNRTAEQRADRAVYLRDAVERLHLRIDTASLQQIIESGE